MMVNVKIFSPGSGGHDTYYGGGGGGVIIDGNGPSGGHGSVGQGYGAGGSYYEEGLPGVIVLEVKQNP